jgi:hypothetical protein
MSLSSLIRRELDAVGNVQFRPGRGHLRLSVVISRSARSMRAARRRIAASSWRPERGQFSLSVSDMKIGGRSRNEALALPMLRCSQQTPKFVTQ